MFYYKTKTIKRWRLPAVEGGGEEQKGMNNWSAGDFGGSELHYHLPKPIEDTTQTVSPNVNCHFSY